MNLKTLFLVCLAGAAVVGITSLGSFRGQLPAVLAGEQQLVSPVNVTDKLVKPPSEPPKLESGLGKVVGGALAGSEGIYAVSVKNLKTGETFSVNDQRRFDSASLYKLWVMGEAYDQIQMGKLSEDEVLSKDVTSLNSDFAIDSQDADLTDGTITLTVRDALSQMITISHNYAALLLADRIGLSKIRTYLADNGIEDSTVGNTPLTTASDVEKFLEKLYHGQLANEKYTKEMTDLLKAQQLNEKLPKYLPDGVSVAHKTGELNTFSHDAGIVYSTTGDYLIVILSETDNPDGANDRIGLVSKAVYDYFLTH